MSKTFSIACKDCKKHVWIGHSSLKDFTLYTGVTSCMEELRKFLWNHKGHNLIFDENCELEIGDWEEIEFD